MSSLLRAHLRRDSASYALPCGCSCCALRGAGLAGEALCAAAVAGSVAAIKALLCELGQPHAGWVLCVCV